MASNPETSRKRVPRQPELPLRWPSLYVHMMLKTYRTTNTMGMTAASIGLVFCTSQQ